jgi:hypothetical protein
MTLENSNCQKLILNTDTLAAYQNDPTPFEKIEFTGYFEGSDESVTITDSIPACNSGNSPIKTCDNIIYAFPELFGQIETLKDGVYKVQIKSFYTDNTITTEFACIFVDCETKCKVIESQCLEAMMFHYVLTQSYSCNCSCDKLQDIWDALQTKLVNGCKEC